MLAVFLVLNCQTFRRQRAL